MTQTDKEKIGKLADSLVKLLSSYRETKMKRVKLSERLSRLNVRTIAELLNYFVTRSEQDDVRFRPVIECLLDIPFLVSVLGNEKMSRIYNRLEERGYYDVRALLVPHPHIRRRALEDDTIAFPDMEQLPLGMKKTLAKSDKKHTLDKLIYEEHPVIIRNLLNNPRITEWDVLKIVTRRPIKKTILKEVIGHRRWISRYIVKKAVIRNPYSPAEISLNLLHHMLLQDLVEIAKDAGLHYSIRSVAQRLIKKKRERAGEEE